MSGGRASNNIPPSIRKIWQQEEARLNETNSHNSSPLSADPSTLMASAISARAIVSHDMLKNDGWKMETVTLRPLQAGELLVEMVATGICHTDALIGDMPSGSSPIAFYPRILGHEGSGYVKEIGEGVTVAKPGDAVLCSFAYCSECVICKAGHFSHCSDFNALNFEPTPPIFKLASNSSEQFDIDGAFFGQSSFAQYSIVKSCSVVNATNLITSKHELQLFAPLGCGIQTGSGTVINVSGASETDVICITGLGGVGLAAVMGAKIKKCRTIIGIDRVASRLALAQDLGCTHVVDGSDLPAGKTLGDVVKELADGVGPTITIDTTGAPVLIDAGLAFTRNRGKYIQVGSPPFDFQLSSVNAFEFMVAGKQLIGAIEGQAYPPDYVPRMVQWYREGKFPIDKLMKLIPADNFQQALHEMHSGQTIKPILTW